jgi:branched-chain amino acid transport system substrate-binding protein
MTKHVRMFLAVTVAVGLALSWGGCSKKPEPAAPGKEGAVPAAPAGTAAGQKAPAGEPYKIGAIFSVTGPASFLGDPEKKTAQMIVDTVNRKGGVNGHPVELIVYDDAGEETTAVMHMKKLVESDRVLAVAGPSLSGTTLAVIPIAEESQIPLVSCAASILITRPVKKWVFQTPQTDVMAVEKILEHLKARAYTKIGIITVSNGYGKSGKAALEEILPANGFQIVANEVYNPNPPDLRVQIENLKAAAPQAVICWDTNPGPATLAKNMQEMGVKIPLIMSHGVASKKFIELAGSAADGIVLPAGKLIVAAQLPDSDPQKAALLEYSAAYKAAYHEPESTFGGHGWDAIQQIILALESAGPDRTKIRDALEEQKDFKGVGGVFKHTENDHNGLSKDAFALVVVRNGDWQLLAE